MALDGKKKFRIVFGHGIDITFVDAVSICWDLSYGNHEYL